MRDQDDPDDGGIAVQMAQLRLREVVARRLDRGRPRGPLDAYIRRQLGRHVTRHRRLRRAFRLALTRDERTRWVPDPPRRRSVCLVCDPAMTNGAARGLPAGPGRP